jgi:prepilin-type N-terminal cleavage/methylation domain-containing protein
MIQLTQLPIHKKSIFKNKGFTLIELLVSITIMMLMVGMGLVSYINFNEKQQLAGAAKELQTYLRSAQTRARNGDVPTGCVTLEGYNIQMAQDTSLVTTRAICSNGNYTRSEHNLNGGVMPNTAIDMTFHVLRGGVTGAQNVTLILGERSYTFKVTAGGEINQGEMNE